MSLPGYRQFLVLALQFVFTTPCSGSVESTTSCYRIGQGMPSPKYGDIAIKKLIEKMNALGSLKQNIVAKIFGGAEQLGGGDGSYNIGSRNVSVAETSSLLKVSL